jgi:hypothetical protein
MNLGIAIRCKVEPAMTGGRVKHHALAIADRALRRSPTSSPFSAAASHSWLLVQPMDLRAPRSMTCAPPPKASRRGSGAGQGVLEPPEAGEVELFRKAQHEADDGLDIAVLVVMDPEGAALGRVLAREVEACDLRVVGVLIRARKLLEQRERAGSLVGGADVEQA